MKPFKYPSGLNLIGSMVIVLFFYNNEKRKNSTKRKKKQDKSLNFWNMDII
jgi:hypothetical protein